MGWAGGFSLAEYSASAHDHLRDGARPRAARGRERGGGPGISAWWHALRNLRCRLAPSMYGEASPAASSTVRTTNCERQPSSGRARSNSTRQLEKGAHTPYCRKHGVRSARISATPATSTSYAEVRCAMAATREFCMFRSQSAEGISKI